MQTAVVVALLCVLSANALTVPAAEDKEWNQALDAFARKFSLVDYGAYRSGLMNRDQLAAKVATEVNAAAKKGEGKGVASCEATTTGGGHQFSCQLTIPGIDLQVAKVQVNINGEEAKISLVIGGQTVPLKTVSLTTLYSTGISIDISKTIGVYGGPAVAAVSKMLVAEIIVKAKAVASTDSTICVSFKVGMRGPMGMAIPGMPLPVTVELMCKTVPLAPPSTNILGTIAAFAKKALQFLSFGLIAL